MIHSKRFLVCVFYILCSLSEAYSQNLMNYENSLRYANFLFQSKQYNLAITEYQRVSFLKPEDTVAKLRLVQSYRLLNDYSEANNRIESLFPETKINFPGDFAHEYFSNLYHQQEFTEANYFLTKNSTINESKKNEYEIGILLKQYKWAEAKLLADNYLLNNSKPPKLDQLYPIAIQGMKIHYKKPVCAALFSAVIPGSGKLYTKDWKDAIFAFLFVSATTMISYQSIANKRLPINSVIYSSVALSFYAANIYGSYKSAKRYNKKINQITTQKIDTILFESKETEP